LAAVASAFVAEGLGRNERVAYVGQGRPRQLRADLAGIPGLDERVDRGQLQVTDIAALPGSDPLSDPVDELIDLAALTQDALDAGYIGLRVVANGTVRVVDPRRRDRIVRYEHLIDRFCLDHAFTRLCVFDAAALGGGVLAELGCVHTLTRRELSPFVLCAGRGVDAALIGSVDAFSVDLLVEALRRIGGLRPAGRVVLDATGLEFVDVRALRELDHHAADTGAPLVLRSPPAYVSRLLELLGVRAIRVEASA
jgi:anti-anti-sigma regulatory factor